MLFLELRKKGYELISGSGIEVGAFEHPAKLPNISNVKYCDAITPEEAIKLFPEISHIQLNPIDYIIDLNKEHLSLFRDNSQDFVVINHVIEHLIDPISITLDLFRVIKPGGKLVIAAPDKEFTFDKLRPETTYETLEDRKARGLKDSSIYDYLDMAKYVHPHLVNLPKSELEKHLQVFKNRREHLNIWTSINFKSFLTEVVKNYKIPTKPVYEVLSDQNRFEYFGVWEKS